MRRSAFRRMFNGRPITWLLRDEFSDTRAAGAVNGTMATPGPGGARTVTDTTNYISVANGLVISNAVGFSDPRASLDGVARSPGTLIAANVNFSSSLSNFEFSALSALGSFGNPGIGVSSDGSLCVFVLGSFGLPYVTPAGYVSANSPCDLILLLRANGACFMSRRFGESPKLHWANTSGSHSPAYPQVSRQSSAASLTVRRMIAVSAFFLPIPLASDGFGGTFGVTNGAGHAETSGIGSGGGNVTWTQQIGTWANSAGKAAAATLSGGVAVATVPLSTADVFAKVKVTRSAGSGGMVLRWTDANNHLYTEHDGTNAYLKQVLSGSTTTLITAAATYSAGTEIAADLDGTAGRLYYNSQIVGSTGSISSSLTSTLHGLRSTDTGGIQLDDFVVYAKGTGGEYNLLNRYVNL